MFTLSEGHAAANCYFEEYGKVSTLTLDWSYDEIYYNHGDGWNTINKDELKFINTPEKKEMFKKLAYYAINNIYHIEKAENLLKQLLVIAEFL